MTDRAIRFIDEAGNGNWCLHLSYIKPHWPYMAAAPYHDTYRDAPVPAANRSREERRNPHPVVDAFRGVSDSLAFRTDEAREAVIPTYMGLVSQVDRHLGRLLGHLDAKGMLEETLIVFTSDHGDYLGDHWLGDKDLFYEEAARIPMIVVDPDERAAGTRGTRNGALVEAIDLIPTFLDCLGAANDESAARGPLAAAASSRPKTVPRFATPPSARWITRSYRSRSSSGSPSPTRGGPWSGPAATNTANIRNSRPSCSIYGKTLESSSIWAPIRRPGPSGGSTPICCSSGGNRSETGSRSPTAKSPPQGTAREGRP